MRNPFIVTVYNKIFTKILDSSIWLETDSTRLVWLTMIAAMDENGFVQFASPRNLAHRARISEELTEKALICLEGPDKDSSDHDNGGRRVERVPGGWMVLNAHKYREIVTRAINQEQTRVRVARFRDKKKGCNAGVTLANDLVTPSDTVSEADTVSVKTVGRVRVAALPSDDDWIASLKTNPAYVGINVPIEVAKCQSWCDANRKQASRRRIINWLNRSERPVAFGAGSQSNGQSKDVYKEPSWDWQTAIREKWPLSDYPGRVRWEEGVWGNVPLDRRAEILRGR